jgi:hypothetical protein
MVATQAIKSIEEWNNSDKTARLPLNKDAISLTETITIAAYIDV